MGTLAKELTAAVKSGAKAVLCDAAAVVAAATSPALASLRTRAAVKVCIGRPVEVRGEEIAALLGSIEPAPVAPVAPATKPPQPALPSKSQQTTPAGPATKSDPKPSDKPAVTNSKGK